MNQFRRRLFPSCAFRSRIFAEFFASFEKFADFAANFSRSFEKLADFADFADFKKVTKRDEPFCDCLSGSSNLIVCKHRSKTCES